MIEPVVFDVDGVLVQGGAFGERLRRELGIERASLEAFWRGPFAECSLGRSDLKREVEPFLRQWGYPGSVDAFLLDWFEADSRVNHDVLREVERLRSRRVPCYVASTQERHRAAYLAGTMGLATRFDRLFFSCNLGSKKPQLEFFESIRAELDVPAAALLLLDDQMANVEAARSVGWNAELYTIGGDLAALIDRHPIAGARPVR